MPRGFAGKQARAQKRATESGRSTRGSSHSSVQQLNGRRSKKKEICLSGSQMKIIHNGNVYSVNYRTEVLEEWFKRLFCIEHTHGLIITSIVNDKYIERGTTREHSLLNNGEKHKQLIKEITSKFHKKMGGRFISKLK